MTAASQFVQLDVLGQQRSRFPSRTQRLHRSREVHSGGGLQQFLEAVADSNLAKMAELWGTAKGSAAQTGQPNDYERRIIIMQAYLRDRRHRLMSNAQEGSDPGRRIVQVEFRRGDCVKMVPFSMVRTESGDWLVNSIDLALLGAPGGNCDENADG